MSGSADRKLIEFVMDHPTAAQRVNTLSAIAITAGFGYLMFTAGRNNEWFQAAREMKKEVIPTTVPN